MDEIDELSDLLNQWVPIDLDFRVTLRNVLKCKHKDHLDIMLKIGRHVEYAWQLLSGFVIAIRVGRDGTKTVIWIYFANCHRSV